MCINIIINIAINMQKMARIFFVLLFIALGKGNEIQPIDSLKLEQVLMLSRHNIRTPLTGRLEMYSSKIWPKFNESVAELTRKGALLESYMAEYITEWLESKDFIKGCPTPKEVLIYSNTAHRTRDTAKSFANAVFGSCNIPYTYNDDINNFDPLFHTIYHNNSEYFKQIIFEEMKNKLEDNDLRQSYLELNRILDIQNSTICKRNSICDISVIQDEVILIDNEEPNVKGRSTISANIFDNFLMSYYNGFPIENVAWGQIPTDEIWALLAKIIKLNLDVRFNITSGAKDIAAPLLNFMFSIFRSGTPKFTVLVGHDSNLNSVISALGFEEFTIKNSHEPFPIGGKLTFQKWSNCEKSYLKVEYIYQTSLQLRNGDKLSLEQPPERILMELKGCKIDEYGFCPWNDFINMNF